MLKLKEHHASDLFKRLKENKELELNDNEGVYNTSLTVSYNEKFQFKDFKEKLETNKYKTLIFKVV